MTTAEAMSTTSPFLEGTAIQFAWDSTSLKWAKTCPRLYYYSMICGYQSMDESIHLRFGREYHKALEEYDLCRAIGYNHDDAEREVVKQLMLRLEDYEDPDPGAKRSIALKTKDNLLRTVIWYLEQFENDPAKTHILQNGEPAVELTFKFELDFGPGPFNGNFSNDLGETISQPYLLCGHLDRVVNFNDELFVMDRKTTTTTPSTHYFNKYEPDNQMTLYSLAGQIILKSPIRGVIIDAAQILTDSSRFVRGITYRSPDQLEEWLDDLKHHLRVFENYAAEGYWPQNDTACDNFGGCRFREICSKSPKVRETYLSADFTEEHPWNPLEIR